MNKKAAPLCILMIALMLALTLPANAAGIRYKAPDLYLSLEIPDKFCVFTRETSNLDMIYDSYGINAEDFKEYLEYNDIYIDGLTDDFLTEFLLVGIKNEDTESIFDYNLLSDTQFESYKEPLKTEFEKNGMTVSDISTYSTATAKYFVISYSDHENGQSVSGIRYSTIYNGMAINLTLYSATGSMADEKVQVIKNIVDSVKFTKTLKAPASAYDTGKTVVLIVTVIGIAVLLVYIFSRKGKADAAKSTEAEVPEADTQNTDDTVSEASDGENTNTEEE